MPNDYFSPQAQAYKLFRPGYPARLFAALVDGLGENITVWDCATGNGQAALKLADRAALVLASDLSAAQLAHAAAHANVRYIQAIAESMPLADRSIDLITVAQAIHWFNFERFYAEAARILRPGGRIAAWTYSFLAVAPQLGAEIDRVVRWFYHDVVGPYWPPERRWVDDRYATLPFPFAPLSLPDCSIEVSWDLNALLGYIGSWSATQRFRDAEQRDPVPLLAARLTPLWGEPQHQRILSWQLAVRCGTRL